MFQNQCDNESSLLNLIKYNNSFIASDSVSRNSQLPLNGIHYNCVKNIKTIRIWGLIIVI